MTCSAADRRLAWTQLGTRMGYTRSRSQREEILAGIRRMIWTPTTTCLPRLDGPAARVIVTAVFHHRPDQLRQVGVIRVGRRQELVGLEDVLGTRRYLLDLGTEAIYLLTEFVNPVPQTQRRVA